MFPFSLGKLSDKRNQCLHPRVCYPRRKVKLKCCTGVVSFITHVSFCVIVAVLVKSIQNLGCPCSYCHMSWTSELMLLIHLSLLWNLYLKELNSDCNFLLIKIPYKHSKTVCLMLSALYMYVMAALYKIYVQAVRIWSGLWSFIWDRDRIKANLFLTTYACILNNNLLYWILKNSVLKNDGLW